MHCTGAQTVSGPPPPGSAREEAGVVAGEAAELVGQVLVVFGEEAAPPQAQKLLGVLLHDGSCRSEDKGGEEGRGER